jgi:aminopeptidase N
MKLTKAIQDGKLLNISHHKNVHYIDLIKNQELNKIESVELHFEGKPKEAINPPWDGGFTWMKDINGIDFIATSCQGLGASVWWPNKDHMYDEVDSMKIKVNVPKHLVAVSNGRLISFSKNEKTSSFTWSISNPINNYGVNINIGNYINFDDYYDGEKGLLQMQFYVLKHNLEKAKTHFKEARKMMEAFEYWFGPYPFYEDTYKLVEVPYLGMEHQSSVTYGNKFKNGYLGSDLSETGWGLKFDFIIVHESGHEWFANSITNKDVADMWIHEGFTSYAENLFLDYYYGKKASAEYVIGTRKRIKNDKAIIGDYNVNNIGSTDMYYKAANMIHMLRQLTNDDSKWRNILRKLNNNFYHRVVTSNEIEKFLSNEIGIDLKPLFNQYLRDTKIPVFEYKIRENKMHYRWTNVVENFNMPIEIIIDNSKRWIYPTESWKISNLNFQKIDIDKDYYVKAKNTK